MKIFSAVLVALPLFAGCCASASAVPKAPAPAVKAPANRVKLQLPPAIYAVPGVESCIYFDNVVCVVNPDNYVFDVKCAKGRNDQKRWRYTPAAGEKGSFDLELTVLSDNGVEAVGKTKVIVTPADAGKGRNFAILVIGDSLTAASVYPKRTFDLLTRNGHPQVKFLGTTGRTNSTVKHEGYGGWAWKTFLTKTQARKIAPGEKPRAYYRASPFLFKGKFSLAQYLKENHQGRVPDFITIQLGVNDVFGATDANQSTVIAGILENADKLIAALRKDAPKAFFDRSNLDMRYRFKDKKVDGYDYAILVKFKHMASVPTQKFDFELDTADFPAGDYRIAVEIRLVDRTTGKTAYPSEFFPLKVK